jgi:addiction module HigA family antidote
MTSPRNQMRPISPGEVLQEALDELKLSAAAFARKLHVPTKCITEILNGTRALTPDTAHRLEQFFGTNAQFWLNLQTGYDLRVAETARSEEIPEASFRRSFATVLRRYGPAFKKMADIDAGRAKAKPATPRKKAKRRRGPGSRR